MINNSFSAISGPEGTGKTTIIKHLKNKMQFAVVPETARVLMPLIENVMKNSKDDLSYKTFIAYFTNIHFLFNNNLNINVVSDRCLLDSLTYLKLYGGDQQINLHQFSDYIKKFADEYQRDSIYDHVIMIKHPKDKGYIKENIISDPQRLYGNSVSHYKMEAEKWEHTFLEIANFLKKSGLFNELHMINAYPENNNVIGQTLNIIGFEEKVVSLENGIVNTKGQRISSGK